MNTPGESSQVVTAIEGYAMARSGRAGVALSISIIGAVIAGTIATLGLTVLSPVLVEVASQLRATDYFALIGIDFVSGDARFTFGRW